MSSSPAIEPSSPSNSNTTPSSPALRTSESNQFHTSTPNISKGHRPALSVLLPSTAPPTPPAFCGEPTLTPPPRSPGIAGTAGGDSRHHPPDGTSSDKSSETAVGGVRAGAALSRKESYKAQRQHYRREKKRAASALLHSIEDPAVVVLADWLKVRGSLKSWTKLWCVLKPGLLLLYKSPKAKSSHWVGTVLLTSCQVIERPSKKDGFCFKLYHPLEQSIWAPRGPHNETIGAVVQPLPTAHLIFRAPSQAAGHCWLDGLELALRCTNAMLRCSRSRPEQTVAAQAPTTQTNISHEELEKHFNEHDNSLTPIMCISHSPNPQDSPATKKNKSTRKLSKWAQFIESIEIISKEHASTDSQTPESEKRDLGFLDCIRKKEMERHSSCNREVERDRCRSLTSSPFGIDLKKAPILRCFDLPKLPLTSGEKRSSKDGTRKCLSPIDLVEENMFKFMATPLKRRSSTPSQKFAAHKTITDLRDSGVKTDTENQAFIQSGFGKNVGSSQVLGNEIIITKTAPSIEGFRRSVSSSSEDERKSHFGIPRTPEKYSLINYKNLPSVNLRAGKEMEEGRLNTQNVYMAGKIVRTGKSG